MSAKVVCIKGKEGWETYSIGEALVFADPSFGEICTIACVEVFAGECVLGLVGYQPDDVSYLWSGFRPLVTLEADLEAHFSQLLHVPSTHTVDA